MKNGEKKEDGLMRIGKALLTALLCGLFLLLLSALVVGPEAEFVPPVSSPAPARASLLPASASPAVSSQEAAAVTFLWTALFLAWTFAERLPQSAPVRDANGRVLRRRRYWEGAYLLFRQELAVG